MGVSLCACNHAFRRIFFLFSLPGLLESLREWLVNVADRFTINPSMVDESKMHDEIKDFGKIVDDVIASLAKERYGFWARKRGRSVLYGQLSA